MLRFTNLNNEGHKRRQFQRKVAERLVHTHQEMGRITKMLCHCACACSRISKTSQVVCSIFISKLASALVPRSAVTESWAWERSSVHTGADAKFPFYAVPSLLCKENTLWKVTSNWIQQINIIHWVHPILKIQTHLMLVYWQISPLGPVQL